MPVYLSLFVCVYRYACVQRTVEIFFMYEFFSRIINSVGLNLKETSQTVTDEIKYRKNGHEYCLEDGK
jgi:hypothetical protein